MKQENTYQKNGDIVTGAVAKNNRAPQYADDLMRGNEDIAKAAVAKNDALSPHAVEAIVCEIKKEFFKRFEEEEFHTDSRLRDFCQDVRRRFGEAVYNSVNPWQWLGEARTNGTPCKGCKYVQFFPDQCPCVGCTRNQTHNDFYVMSENTAERLKTFAEELNGMQYGDEPKELWEKAKKNGCVVVFGCSDDLIEFRGAIDDELGCFEGGMYYFNRNGDFVNELEKDCPNSITAVWCGMVDGKEACPKEQYTDSEGRIIPWVYLLNIPHETFMIYENDEPYCRGIVFAVNAAV